MASPYARHQAKIEAAEREIAALRAGMRDLLAHMETPKFHGPENGWISTTDVARWIHSIEAAGTEAAEQAPAA